MENQALQVIDEQVVPVTAAAYSCNINSIEDVEKAMGIIGELAAIEDEILGLFKKNVSAAHKLHKEEKAGMDKYLSPVQSSMASLKARIGSWYREDRTAAVKTASEAPKGSPESVPMVPQKVKGLSVRFEQQPLIVDDMQLIKAVASGKVSRKAISGFSMAFLKRQLNDGHKVPGVIGADEPVVTVRKDASTSN
ncbi:MAG: hypothetical protein ACYTEQ_01755 [Planctomycetota bacterium]|jgi:hypothetical protein